MEQNKTERKWRTLSDLMEANSGESLEAVARVAPAIERIISKSGLLRSVLEKGGTAKSKKEAVDMAEDVASALLRYCLGENIGDAVEVLAAINGMTSEELKANTTTWELVGMIKAIVTDEGFFTWLRTLND